MKMEIEMLSKQLIKPSSPTPHHLRQYQLSFIDQRQEFSLPIISFYSNTTNLTNSQKCNILKKSLSQVLTIFYPLAGRIKNNSYFECNDEGFLLVEAKANCDLSVIVQDRNPDNNNYFIPLKPDQAGDIPAFGQITLFNCGGLAVSFAMAHKIGDGFSMFSFLNSWAAVARGNSDIYIPSFGWANHFPPINLSCSEPRTTIPLSKEKIVTKIFVFDSSAIGALVAKYTVNGIRPSQVEALAAFIWSRFMATTQGEEAKNKVYLVSQTVDLRSRMEPALPKLSFGNLSWAAVAEADMNNGKEEECYGILKRIRDSIRNVNADYVKNINNKAETFGKEVVSLDFSSLCSFPIYETDFGWGTPLWVGTTPLVSKNLVYLRKTKEGKGLQAWISLKEDDMAKFEIDSHLLSFLSPSTPNGNPLPFQSRL